ncbi:isochorismatase family protein [Amycolatopsis sp. NPDC021455]|uniref:isochorismatase family protein n=1 Tax=Amycolatopsis sp. NPDC021455 TaxID=3154901 RepID=UPI0033E45AC1
MGIPVIAPYPMPAEADLPGNTATWTADPDRALLLVHDMQRYFLQPFPSGRQPGDALVRNVAMLRETCRRSCTQVAYTAQPGGMTEGQRGLLRDFWGPGMRVDPADRQIVEPLTPAPDDWVFTKWRYSAFSRSDLLARMRDHGLDQLIVCGVYGHVGVLATALEAFANDIQTFLVADAVADFSPGHHRLTMEYAASRCAVVATTSTILAHLTTPASDTAPTGPC